MKVVIPCKEIHVYIAEVEHETDEIATEACSALEKKKSNKIYVSTCTLSTCLLFLRRNHVHNSMFLEASHLVPISFRVNPKVRKLMSREKNSSSICDFATLNSHRINIIALDSPSIYRETAIHAIV